MPDQEVIAELTHAYAVPWGINILLAILVFVVGKFIVSIIVSVLGRILGRTKLDKILVEFVQSVVNTILLIFVIVASLDQLGVNTTSLIAVLGAIGLAVGLALQGSLQNFASGFMLLVFRPFKAGDFVEGGGTMGVVERISIFTTTMRTPDNKEVIIPNGAIYGGNIINWSARETRRVDMVFSISYDDDIRKAKKIISEVFAKDERILPEPEPTIVVGELGDSSVDILARPWVKTDDYWPLKWHMTEEIKIAFDENDISIPFPQMDIHLDKAQ
ncbi:mechanosensitive ion channel family protein [Marinimicrobium alkaliphilum]|uniref:mechanosensitive ion channel family protein n=1 Tax=Marinimicrobium alkaliphilum TaxID=2202654 RepID=UPI000DB91315|nr:mechanosensitive ion channel domain-containing protein [Marinimicrobium alkaliphilum]